MSETYLITQKMITKKICTEDKILKAAYKTFLLYGYHGTALQQIATDSGVNKAAIHYYFRSKRGLYTRVVEMVVALLHDSKAQMSLTTEEFEKLRWFLFTELYNHNAQFKKSLMELCPNDWDMKLNEINVWIENFTIPS